MSLSFEDRARGAILGQFVGDAMSLGSHWHYNLRERARLYPDGIDGFEQPTHDHYHKTRTSGDSTHYGDAALLLLESLIAARGFDAQEYGQRFVAYFDDPACRGYLDKPTRLTIQAYKDAGRPHDYPFDNGPDDFQTVVMCRLAPLVVFYAGRSELSKKIEAVVRINQNNAQALAHNRVYGCILDTLLAGEPLEHAVKKAVESYEGEYRQEIGHRFDDALAMAGETVVNATGLVGRSCYLPCTFPAILHAALRHRHSFADGVLETVRAGGDNASRAAIVGAWLGALHGRAAIPEEWLSKFAGCKRVTDLVDKLLAIRRT